MGKKKNAAPPIDKASATLRKPKGTDVEKVQLTRSMSQSMQSSASWAAATDVHGAVTVWNKTADDIEANAKTIAQLRDQLATAENKQQTLRRDWRAATSQVVSTVNVFCAGSADLVKGFNFDLRQHGGSTAPGVVGALTVATGLKTGDIAASWQRGDARHGFVVQWATDPSNAATYSAQTPCTRTKYTLGGLPSGSVEHFRVAAVDPKAATGIGPWSAWVPGTAR